MLKSCFASIISEKEKDPDPHLLLMDLNVGGQNHAEPQHWKKRKKISRFNVLDVGYGTLPGGPEIKELHLLEIKIVIYFSAVKFYSIWSSNPIRIWNCFRIRIDLSC